jgi:quercetin dioxygenase-like cupin family protein
MKRRNFITTASIIPMLSYHPDTIDASYLTDTGFVVKANQSRYNESTVLSAGTSPNDIKVSGKDTKNKLSVFEYTGRVRGGPPLHIHLKQDEIFFIVEGDYKFKVGSETHLLTKGDTIFLPRKVPHAFAQLSEYGKMYFIFQPAGKMEEYFRNLASFTGQPSPEEGAKLFLDHEMKIVGPPLEF